MTASHSQERPAAAQAGVHSSRPSGSEPDMSQPTPEPNAPTEQLDPTALRRITMAGAAGTVVEWFDFGLYSAASALVFGPLFFPSHSDLASTMAAFATFAVGFVARPFGGILASHYGDRIGRKPVLIATIVLMGAATTLIGLLPTYDSIGYLAPALLVLIRIAQGLGAGAEWAGAITAISEYAPRGRRAFYTSWGMAAIGLGLGGSTGVFALTSSLVSRETLLDWAWRVPFLLSIVIFAVALFIRRKIEETPAFARAKNAVEQQEVGEARVPIVAALRNSPKELLLGVLCGCGINVQGYLVITFAISYVTQTLGMSSSVGTLAVCVAAIGSFFTVPVLATVADRIGYRRMFLGGAVASLIWVVPMFLLLDTRNAAAVVFALTVAYALAQAMMLSTQAVFLAEMFPTRYRFTGVAFSREVNAALFAGTTPFIATGLVALNGGGYWLVVAYNCFAMILTAVAVVFSRRSGVRNADDDTAATDLAI